MIYLLTLSIFLFGCSYIYWLEEQKQTELSLTLEVGDPGRVKAIEEAKKNEIISDWLFLASMILLFFYLWALAYSFV